MKCHWHYWKFRQIDYKKNGFGYLVAKCDFWKREHFAQFFLIENPTLCWNISWFDCFCFIYMPIWKLGSHFPNWIPCKHWYTWTGHIKSNLHDRLICIEKKIILSSLGSIASPYRRTILLQFLILQYLYYLHFFRFRLVYQCFNLLNIVSEEDDTPIFYTCCSLFRVRSSLPHPRVFTSRNVTLESYGQP